MYRSKHQTETLEKYVQIQSNQRDKSLRELKRMHEEIQDLVLDACRVCDCMCVRVCGNWDGDRRPPGTLWECDGSIIVSDLR